MDNLTDEEKAVLKKLLTQHELQLLIGAEEWDLSEDEENILWRIIRRIG